MGEALLFLHIGLEMRLYEYAFDIIPSLMFREEFSYGLRTRKLAKFIHSHSLFPFAINCITITQ